MCRIVGIWSNTDRAGLVHTCIRMRETLIAGGPDNAGIFVDRSAGLALGHRRLSVIDLSETGSQPMTTPDKRYSICYNGEVYNYSELKSELQAQGFAFRGTSDTEVVLNAFSAWGPACVEKFIGIFAFAVWDSAEKCLYLFRDRLGVKPLYYYCHDGTFAFASELKALHAGFAGDMQVNTEVLGEFFHYGYISSPRSIYHNTWKLEPGCWLKVTSSGTLEKNRYWSWNRGENDTRTIASEDSYIEQLQEIMSDAFSKRLIADVPVGVFLSGGIDSSLVTAILAKNTHHPIRTFTVGFQEKNYDESIWARRIAEHLCTEHIEETVTPDHVREILPLWSEIYDEPFGDISGIPTTLISRITRQHVKVSLSADGGDELFCGYHRYWVMNALDRFTRRLPSILPKIAGKLLGAFGSDRAALLSQAYPKLRLPAIKDRMRKLHAVLSQWNGSAWSAYPSAVSYWLPHEVSRLIGIYRDPRPPLDTSCTSLLDAMMSWDLQHYLPEDILTKVDRATMYNGLEGRDPFLDHRIVEFARDLPLDMKYRNGETKYILKQILKRYLPEDLFMRPKQGFAVPIYTWLHDDLIDLVSEHLNPDALRAQTYLDPTPVMDTVSEFQTKRGSVAVDRIWLLLVFMMWRQHYHV
ncbi:MAG TPA: asparagine synthase (glutamine-hydrolyzing) [Bacteroidales bacterium]|jgi:asparagine synthase (glutamine-hydrolysing)|nr:asparagine synthase (glutamine-hydrolyzing) [Deltaproteobacteria bacterium]HQB53444.1 asparagine synthase (glutamine-hydrolyzing) [Bacteroidales bacterium]